MFMRLACTWVSVSVCMGTHAEARGGHCVLPFSAHVFKTQPRSEPTLAISPALMVQRAPVVHLSLFPQHCGYEQGKPSWFLRGCWGFEHSSPGSHSKLSYPLHHRPNASTLFSQTGHVTECGALFQADPGC